MSIILASASPRRKELLEMLGFNDMRIVPARGEEVVEKGLEPGELVEQLALQKAREVASRCGTDELIIAADTIVWHEGRVFGKPRSEGEAKSMLLSLSGCTHQVYTGMALLLGNRELSRHERSNVSFRSLSEEEAEAYIRSGEPMDKAGAYGAQGLGALFVKAIDGDFFNVMGLPLCSLGEMLKELGVNIL